MDDQPAPSPDETTQWCPWIPCRASQSTADRRDTYARTSGMPTNQTAQILAAPDWMAAQGWLIVVMSGPPVDSTAFNTAMQSCGPSRI